MKKWKHQYLWDAVLKNVRVVVSTHQILLDALANDYVRLEGISLLIFDEGKNRFHCRFAASYGASCLISLNYIFNNPGQKSVD